MTKPTFSILLPTFNKAEFIGYAIESVLKQSDGDWELLVSDNASTDGTKEILAKVSDPRVKVSRTDKKLKLTDNWNRAYEMAEGRYVLMMGDDDYLLPDNLAGFREAIAKFPGDKIFYCDLAAYFIGKRRMEYIEGQGGAAPEDWRIHLRWMFAYAYQMWPPSTVFEKEFADRNRGEDGMVYQGPFPDFYVQSLLAIKSGRTIHVEKTLCVAGRSERSLAIQQSSPDKRVVAFNENRYDDGVAPLRVDTFANGFYWSIVKLKEKCPEEMKDFHADKKLYYTTAAAQLSDSALMFLFRKGASTPEFKSSVSDLRTILGQMPAKMKLVDFPIKLAKRLAKHSPDAIRMGVINRAFFALKGMRMPKTVQFGKGHRISDCASFFEARK
ncbi:Glycosyl transferase family 2 [uncultured archaeon]|nr:Glycosyl transferase family 2 [uncultured archaeon]